MGPLVKLDGRPLWGSDDKVKVKVVAGPLCAIFTVPPLAIESWSYPWPEEVVMEASTGPVPVIRSTLSDTGAVVEPE